MHTKQIEIIYNIWSNLPTNHRGFLIYFLYYYNEYKKTYFGCCNSLFIYRYTIYGFYNDEPSIFGIS